MAWQKIDRIGQHFGYRERAHTLGEPLRPVEFLKLGPPKSNKVRIRWLDGEFEGLDEWVPKVRLVVPWEEAEAFLRDERSLLDALDASGDVRGNLEWKAVEKVLLSLPIGDDVLLGYKGSEREILVIDHLDIAAPRIGLRPEELLTEPHAFVDRFGTYKAPFPVVRRVAQIGCRVFASHVLQSVQEDEAAIQDAIIHGHYFHPRGSGEGFSITREKAEDWLHEEEPLFSLVREWCGQSAISQFDELRQLRDEVTRLRVLVEKTAQWIGDSGNPIKASFILKELRREPANSDIRGQKKSGS